MEWTTHAEMGSRGIIELNEERLGETLRRGVPFGMDLRPLIKVNEVMAVARGACSLPTGWGANFSDQCVLYRGQWDEPFGFDALFDPQTASVPQNAEAGALVLLKSRRGEGGAGGAAIGACGGAGFGQRGAR